MAHRVTLIPGDGTGPELTEATRRVLEATGVDFEWDVRQAGVDVMEEAGTPLPEETLASVKANGVALKGPITTPIGTGFRSVNVALRHELELYACLRPCKTYAGVRSRYEDVDLVIVRENTEDLYAGIEYEAGRRRRARHRDAERLQPKQIVSGSGISVKPISTAASERIIRFAFEYARRTDAEVAGVTKANIMKFTDGLFLSVFRDVAADYPDVGARGAGGRAHAARPAAGGVRRPRAAEPLRRHRQRPDRRARRRARGRTGANIGEHAAVFEATHGSAPKYKGQNKVNPTAMILSGKLMLDHLGERDAATRLEAAVTDVIAAGEHVTYDLKPTRDDPSAVGTSEYADAIIERLGS